MSGQAGTQFLVSVPVMADGLSKSVTIAVDSVAPEP